MINFTAFRDTRPVQAWQIALYATTGGVVYVGLILLANWSQNPLIGIISAVLLGIVALAVFVGLPIWFILSLIRIRRSDASRQIQNGNEEFEVPTILERFASDNGFEFVPHSYEEAPPVEYYQSLFDTAPGGVEVFITYEVAGSLNSTRFKYYELQVAERPSRFLDLPARRGFGYAHAGDGRRLDYSTILSVEYPIQPWYKGPVQSKNAPNGFVVVEGRVIDRHTALKMFEFAARKHDT